MKWNINHTFIVNIKVCEKLIFVSAQNVFFFLFVFYFFYTHNDNKQTWLNRFLLFFLRISANNEVQRSLIYITTNSFHVHNTQFYEHDCIFFFIFSFSFSIYFRWHFMQSQKILTFQLKNLLFPNTQRSFHIFNERKNYKNF